MPDAGWCEEDAELSPCPHWTLAAGVSGLCVFWESLSFPGVEIKHLRFENSSDCREFPSLCSSTGRRDKHPTFLGNGEVWKCMAFGGAGKGSSLGREDGQDWDFLVPLECALAPGSQHLPATVLVPGSDRDLPPLGC